MKNPPKISVRENVFDHVFKLFSEDLNICACGNPEFAYDLIRDLLGLVPNFQMTKGMSSFVGSEGARYLILGQMEKAGLIDHAFTIDSSDLTPKGRWYYKALHSIQNWSDLDDQKDFAVGLPHDGIECAEECWKLPIFDRGESEPESSSDNSPRE